MKKTSINVTLIFFVLFLFLFSSIIPISTGYNKEIDTDDSSLDNIRFLNNRELHCYTIIFLLRGLLLPPVGGISTRI